MPMLTAGHADYIKNMIMVPSNGRRNFVVSAVDGAMPQTKEHILQTSRGALLFVLLTKLIG